MTRLLVSLIAVAASTQAYASAAQERRIAHRVEVSTAVLDERMESADRIPHYILNRAQCIASVRSVKAGLIFGGEGSTGLVSCKVNGQWSAPSFLNAGGVNFGVVIGAQVVDSVLVFMSPNAGQLLSRARLQLGSEATFAVGPVGEGSGVGSIPNANVLTYSSGSGFYAGFSVNGMILSHSSDRNEQVYGKLTPSQIFAMPSSRAPAAVSSFVAVLNHVTK